MERESEDEKRKEKSITFSDPGSPPRLGLNVQEEDFWIFLLVGRTIRHPSPHGPGPPNTEGNCDGGIAIRTGPLEQWAPLGRGQCCP